MKNCKYLFAFIVSIFYLNNVVAHPMPNSLVLLNIYDEKVKIELQLPVQEFELAYGKNLQNINPQFIKDNQADLVNYILLHTKIYSNQNDYWALSVSNIRYDSLQSELNGVYKELIFEITCLPNSKGNLRQFTLQYDAIIHQVVTHFAIIKVNQDFNNGIVPSEPTEIGTIQLDIESNIVKPFTINLDAGSRWHGFKKMISLGMHHIKAGIDHLMFLLVILLIAPIIVTNSQWSGFGCVKYTSKRVLKIVTAFTVGHSLTLLLISLFPIPNFSQSIEIAIAITILISAIHAITPIFPNKETVITFLFGLIHGSAFASTLFNLNLGISLKFLTVLGFNLGIELMQIIIIVSFLPIIFLSKFSIYKYIRIIGAVLAIIASLAWILERVLNHENVISGFFNHLVQ